MLPGTRDTADTEPLVDALPPGTNSMPVQPFTFFAGHHAFFVQPAGWAGTHRRPLYPCSQIRSAPIGSKPWWRAASRSVVSS